FLCYSSIFSFFFFTPTATTEIYTLSHTTLFRSHKETGRLHHPVGDLSLDPIYLCETVVFLERQAKLLSLNGHSLLEVKKRVAVQDRKSTRLNSSHDQISYAVFCLKKKKKNKDKK